MNRTNHLEKLIDRFVGPVILVLLSLTKYFRRLPKEVKTIGLLKTAAIGDTVIMSGITKDLKKEFPNARIILFIGNSNQIMKNHLPGVDEYHIISLKNLLKTRSLLNKCQLDVMVDFGQWPRIDAIITALSGAFSIGFKTLGQKRHYAYNHIVKHKSNQHEIDNYRDLVSLLVESHSMPELLIPKIPLKLTLPEKYIAIHMWAGGANANYREWASEKWRKLIDYSLNQNIAVVLTGSPEEAVKNRYFVKDNVYNIAGQCSFTETLHIIAKANALVAVNTGVMHIAAALGTPTVALHGPTNPLRWGPLGKHTLTLTPKAPGCGYLNLGFEYEGQRTDCMDFIDYQEVEKSLEKILLHI